MSEAVEHPRTSLWAIQQQLVELVEFREEAQTAEEKEAADAAIESYVKAEIEKVDNISAYLRHCKMMERAAADEIDRVQAHQRAWKTRHDRLKDLVLRVMQATGKTRLEGKTSKFVIKGNGGQRTLKVTDETLIPEEYWELTVTRTLNAQEVRKAIESGVAVPGVQLEERGTHLEVK